MSNAVTESRYWINHRIYNPQPETTTPLINQADSHDVETVLARLLREDSRHADATIGASLEANSRLFREERERLKNWAEDMVFVAEKELADIKAQIKAVRRKSRR